MDRINCDYCDGDMPASEARECEDCGREGLCDDCLGDHGCEAAA
jgi:hypothetical protein